MRLFKFRENYNLNWKYVLGEIVLLFVGISLAIWFNNWNTSNRSNMDKEIALVKITDEIKNNYEEIQFSQDANQKLVEGYAEFNKVFDGTTSQVIATTAEFKNLQKEYPDFFRPSDSIEIKPGVYRYNGNTHVLLELPDLKQIAWETTRTMSITNEFSYECLYQLESLYNLQRRVQNEMDKAADALQKRDLKNLMNILGFTDQLSLQLIDSYNEMLDRMESCR